MGDVLKIGRRYSGDPIPPIPEHTTWIDAGGLRFGIEFRVLNDAIINAEFGSREEKSVQVDGVLPEEDLVGFDSRGVSIHVCDARDGGEYLRFDAFDGDPALPLPHAGSRPHRHHLRRRRPRRHVPVDAPLPA